LRLLGQPNTFCAISGNRTNGGGGKRSAGAAERAPEELLREIHQQLLDHHAAELAEGESVIKRPSPPNALKDAHDRSWY
jgi:hypothetical protein